MVNLRRRVMIPSSADAPAPLYPFINGFYTPKSTFEVTITNGNAVDVYANGRSTSYSWFNLSDCANSASRTGLATLFTIPAGSTVTVKTLCTKYIQAGTGSASVWLIKANATTTSGDADVLLKRSVSTASPFTKMTATLTVAEDTDIGGVFMYGGGSRWTSGQNIAFEVEVYVDGVRYV